jgi:hypothetical protein
VCACGQGGVWVMGQDGVGGERAGEGGDGAVEIQSFLDAFVFGHVRMYTHTRAVCPLPPHNTP